MSFGSKKIKINNSIYTSSGNRNIRLNNNNNNNNTYNFGGSNISINFNGGNNQQISKIFCLNFKYFFYIMKISNINNRY